ncbi:MAG: iron donor protein CyaY [Pseudomonadota bacterium]
MSLLPKDYLAAYEATLQIIEDAIDSQGDELDYENQSGMLTIFCPDGSQVIVSRQAPTEELWLAAKSGGFHFSLADGAKICWRSTRDDSMHLKQRLERVVFEQSRERITFNV